jgi:hypothetical protein
MVIPVKITKWKLPRLHSGDSRWQPWRIWIHLVTKLRLKSPLLYFTVSLWFMIHSKLYGTGSGLNTAQNDRLRSSRLLHKGPIPFIFFELPFYVRNVPRTPRESHRLHLQYCLTLSLLCSSARLSGTWLFAKREPVEDSAILFWTESLSPNGPPG